jgi:protein-disulfide isomerase
MKLPGYRLSFVAVVAVMLIATFSGVSLAGDLDSLNEEPAIGDMALGPKDAKVTIIEYYSATCPHCATFYKDTFLPLKRDYVDQGKVRFVLREYPLDKTALAASMIARCAPKEKFFPIIGAILETQNSWLKNPATGLRKVARFAGFTPASFDDCLDNKDLAQGIVAIRNTARKQFGVNATPTLFINGELLTTSRNFDNMKRIIDPLLGDTPH